MAFAQIKIDVSKRDPVKKEFVKVGETTVFTPILQDIIQYVTSPVQEKDSKAVLDDDGIPVYISDEANWIQGAIIAAVKAQARNKLVSGSANLKDGAKIAENWAELTAEGVRDGSGLALAREFKSTFSEWVNKQGLSEAAAQNLILIVGNKAALALQNDTVKAKVKARLESFAEQLDAATMEKFMRPLTAAMDATNAGADAAADF